MHQNAIQTKFCDLIGAFTIVEVSQVTVCVTDQTPMLYYTHAGGLAMPDYP